MVSLYRRSGVLATVFAAITVVMVLLNSAGVLRSQGALEFVLFSLPPLFLFFVFSIVFLVKSHYAYAKNVPLFFLLYLVGALAISVAFWVMAFLVAAVLGKEGFFQEAFFGQLHANPGLVVWYVLEQLASGALFDFFESYKISLSDLDYDASQVVAGTLTFGTRLTGSAVIASLFAKAFLRAKSD